MKKQSILDDVKEEWIAAPHSLCSASRNDDNTTAFAVSKLILTNFRNYSDLVLELDSSPVVITGANGSGKTNILEAISFLSPGRGLRGIKLDDADKRDADEKRWPWAISSRISCGDEEIQIGTGRDISSASNKRIVKIDGNIIKGQAELAHSFSVMWLTPQMDGLFLSPSSDRRKFLDRLVYNFNPEHASLVYSYEYAVRERSRLLQENGDAAWISVLEAKMAEKSVAIAIARVDAVNIIQESIYKAPTVFPKAELSIDGYVESLVVKSPALEIEELLKQKIYDARRDDFRTGRTSIGTHRSDFKVTHTLKNMPAEFCSTGEQKALLLSIILAEARAKAMWKNNVPVLLLDEVVAHLDANRRAALFEEFLAMGTQVWMTGTDTSLFADLNNKAQFLQVDDGAISSC